MNKDLEAYERLKTALMANSTANSTDECIVRWEELVAAAADFYQKAIARIGESNTGGFAPAAGGRAAAGQADGRGVRGISPAALQQAISDRDEIALAVDRLRRSEILSVLEEIERLIDGK